MQAVTSEILKNQSNTDMTKNGTINSLTFDKLSINSNIFIEEEEMIKTTNDNN